MTIEISDDVLNQTASKTNIKNYTDYIESDSQSWDDYRKSISKTDKAFQDLVITAHKYGIDIKFDKATGKLIKGREELEKLNDKYAEGTKAAKLYAKAQELEAQAVEKASATRVKVKKSIKNLQADKPAEVSPTTAVDTAATTADTAATNLNTAANQANTQSEIANSNAKRQNAAANGADAVAAAAGTVATNADTAANQRNTIELSKNAQANTKLSAHNKKNVTTAKLKNAELKRSVVATKLSTGATKASVEALHMQSGALKLSAMAANLGGKAMRFFGFESATAMVKALGPMVALTAVLTGIQWVINKISDKIPTMSNLKEWAEESAQAYEEAKGKVDEFSSELETVESRIEELSSMGALSFTEQSELERLRKQRAELEKQLSVYKAIAKEKEREATEDAMEVVKGYNDDSEMRKQDRFGMTDEWANIIHSENYDKDANYITNKISAMADDYNEARQEFINMDVDASDDDSIEAWEEKKAEVDDYKQKVIDAFEEIGNLEDINPELLNEEDLKLYNELIGLQNRFYLETGDLGFDTVIQSSLDTDEYNKAVNLMNQLAQSKEAITEQDVIDLFPEETLEHLNNAGITTDRIVQNINSMRNIERDFNNIVDSSSNADEVRDKIDSMISDPDFDIDTSSVEDALGEDLVKACEKSGYSIEQVVEMLKRLQRESDAVKLNNAVNDLASIEGVVDAVGGAIDEFSENGSITANTIKELADSSLASVDGFEEFVDILSDSESSMEDVESAANKVIGAYLDQESALGNLTDKNKDLYIAQLERMGVTNATEGVEARLAVATIQSANASEQAKQKAWEQLAALGAVNGSLDANAMAALNAGDMNGYFAAQQGLAAGNNFAQVVKSHATSLINVAKAAGPAARNLLEYAQIVSQISTLNAQLKSTKDPFGKGAISGSIVALQTKADAIESRAYDEFINLSTPTFQYTGGGGGGSRGSSGGGGSSKQKESPSDKRRDKYKDEKAKLDYQLNQDLISYNTYYSKLKRLGDKYYKNQSGNLADYRDHLEELAKVRKAAYDDEKSDLEYKLGMNQISYSTYYSKMQALDKKWLKGYNGNEEDHRDHLEDMAKVREDAYDNEREKLEYQLNMNQISYSTYYDNLKKLADKWLNDYDSNIEAYRDHLEDMADIRRDAFEDAREDLDKQFADGKISASSYFSKVEALYKKWFEGYTSSKDDLIEAQDELYDTMFDHYDDRLQETIDRIDTYDFFKLYQRGKGDIDQWAKNPVDEWKYFLNEIDRALKKGSLRWEDWYDLHVEGTQQLIEAERELAEAEAERAEESKGNLDSLIDMVSEMLRHEKEEMIDALNEQADKYREITEAKKKSLDLTRAELSYQRELTDMNKDLSDLQAQAAVLKLDTSREGQAKYKELMEEIAQKQQEIADKQSDHAYDATIEGLDNSVEEYEKKIEAEIEEINKLLNNAGDWLKYVYEYINSTEPSALLDELLKYNYEFGSGIDQDIHDIWDNYQNVIVDFQNKKIEEIIELLREQLKAAEEAEKAESDKGNSSENNLPFGEIISKMKANSEAMEEAKKKGDRLTYDKLEKENFELSQQLSSQSHTTWDDMTYDPETGKWTRKDGKDLYESISSKGHTSTEIIDMMERSDDPNEINKLADELREIAWYKNTFYDEKSGRWYAGINSFKKGEALFGGNTSFGPQSSSDYIETMRAMLNAGNIKGVKILIPELRKYSAYKDVFYDDYRGKIFKTGLGYSNGIPMIGSKISKPTASTYINTMKTNKSAFINNRIVPYLRKLSGYSGVYYNEKKGKWYKSKSSKTPLYHDGLKNGFVGEGEYHPTPKQDELYALLRKGELVLNKTDQDRLAVQMQVLSTLTDSLKNASSSVGSSIVNGVKGNVVLQIDAPVTIQGNADQSVVSELKKHGDMISNIALSKLNDTLNMRGYKTSVQINARKK